MRWPSSHCRFSSPTGWSRREGLSEQTCTRTRVESLSRPANVFSSVLAYDYFDASFEITNQGQHQEVYGAYVSGDYFSTLGVSAVVGRALQSSDDQPGAPPVCVIGYGLWRRLYGQSADILGRPIRVNGNVAEKESQLVQ